MLFYPSLTVLHSERQKLHTILAFLSAVGLIEYKAILGKLKGNSSMFFFYVFPLDRGHLLKKRICSSEKTAFCKGFFIQMCKKEVTKVVSLC